MGDNTLHRASSNSGSCDQLLLKLQSGRLRLRLLACTLPTQLRKDALHVRFRHHKVLFARAVPRIDQSPAVGSQTGAECTDRLKKL